MGGHSKMSSLSTARIRLIAAGEHSRLHYYECYAEYAKFYSSSGHCPGSTIALQPPAQLLKLLQSRKEHPKAIKDFVRSGRGVEEKLFAQAKTPAQALSTGG
jgi:hypothetical protein